MRAAIASAALIALAACGSAGEDAENAATAEAVDDGSVKAASDDLPEGVSLPPGAELKQRSEASSGEQKQIKLSFDVDMTPDEVLAFYEGEGIKLERVEHDFWELYGGEAADGTPLELEVDEVFGEKTYVLEIGGPLQL